MVNHCNTCNHCERCNTNEYDCLHASVHLQGKQSAYFNKIMKNQRNEPMYQFYVVSFRGSGFPVFMRDKQFIYRGSAFEKLAELSPQIESQFPDAIVFSAFPYCFIFSKYCTVRCKCKSYTVHVQYVYIPWLYL